MLRVRLARGEEEEQYFLLLQYHHLVSDHVGMEIIQRSWRRIIEEVYRH